ncbi:MAG: hypothetical protein RLZZ427_1276 [Pseudomonadota bacterium]|jgi:uncharacterized repeat protein (TIGR01451 family)
MTILRTLTIAASALCGALMAVAGPSYAQTISNTAAALWADRGVSYSANSNTVEITVQAPAAKIETYAVEPNSGETVPFSPSLCGGKPIVFPAGSSPVQLASLEQSNALRVGDALVFRINAPNANRNAAGVDSLTSVLQIAGSDRELISIYETGPDTGVFVGAIPTSSASAQFVAGDCRLSVAAGEHIAIEIALDPASAPIAKTEVEVLADPFGIVFDSETGAPVTGARVTLYNAQTGELAKVFDDDGVTAWPSSVIAGMPIVDAAGRAHPMEPGEYRFPLAAVGSYRLQIEPPAPYAAPSHVVPAQLTGLRRPDGAPFTIIPASYGKAFLLSGPAPVRVDVPVDHPPLALDVAKKASRPSALPGDTVLFTVTVRNPDPLRQQRGVQLIDRPGTALRLRTDSVRIDGKSAGTGVTVAADGRELAISLGDFAPGAAHTVTYAMTIAADAAAGQVGNVATAIDARGQAATASATVLIEREDLAARMTLVGQVVSGGCGIDPAGTGPAPQPHGLAGVRVVLEDGSYAVTDATGRYHFDGLMPGSHVAQAVAMTLPNGGKFVDCAASTRSAGSASSRFVTGQGGQVVVANFVAAVPTGNPAPSDAAGNPVHDAAAAETAAQRAAAGADTDWLALGDGPTEFLFPSIDHNPRAPAVRVVIRHRVTEVVELLRDGKPVDKVAFDGARNGPGGTFAVSLWRGIPLTGEVTHLAAVIRTERGALVKTLTRDVHFAATPAQIEFLPEQSRLVADGRTRPVVALRLRDRSGRPVHAGLSGEFSLSAPYESAESVAGAQARALTGQGRETTHWLVKGDDGVAYVELAPTLVSGKLHMEFGFADGQQRRRQQIDAWIVPGAQPWTVVGLAEATAGARNIADEMQHGGALDSDLGRRARVAIYAKGPVANATLLTLAYDSAKQRAEQPLLGAIDPRAYYTVFADGSSRRFDAASRAKVYARVDSKGLNALYGDFDAGFDQTQLARYVRATTGLRGELSRGGWHAAGFAARIASRHRHDEFQGAGVSGPYRLSNRAIIPGSEVVSIEVRDRFRSELIVARRALIRFVDYDLDLLTGTITFKEPLLSRDGDLNPQFIVIDYELDEAARGGDLNAGVRGDVTLGHGALRIGASAVSDTSANGANRTNLGALDLQAKLDKATELRAEVGASSTAGETTSAWLVEAERHAERIDLLAYARMADADFGLGQTAGSERGRRKFGVDGRYQVNETLSLSASAWDDAALTDASHRTALQLGALYRTPNTDLRIGVATMQDRLADGSAAGSTTLEGGVTRRALDNRLELSATSSLALGGADAIDLPARHRLALRYALGRAVRLLGNYEIAQGARLHSRTIRVGADASLWQGARITTGLGQQADAERGSHAFAAAGITQSIELAQHLTIDATIDGTRTLGTINPAALVNRAHPASSGGMIGAGGTVAEDFTAATLGASWHDERWNLTGRGEWRDSTLGDSRGLRLGAIRQLAEGTMLGGTFTWTRTADGAGGSTGVVNGALVLAYRPASADLALLGKLELRADRTSAAPIAATAPLGGSAFAVTGDARATRMIGSVALDWTPTTRAGGATVQRSEVSLFAALRRNLDRVADYDVSGTTLLSGLDARYGVGPHFEFGGRGTARANLSDGTTSFSFGPQIGISPAKDALLLIGYNIDGYRDRDFSAAQFTDRGIYASVRFKLDAGTFGFLGLDH